LPTREKHRWFYFEKTDLHGIFMVIWLLKEMQMKALDAEMQMKALDDNTDEGTLCRNCSHKRSVHP